MGRTYAETVAPGMAAKASHVSVLRSFIDDDASDVSPAFRYNFSWSTVTLGQAILAKYLTEMRSAIQLLWNSKLRGPLPDWSSGVVPGGLSNNRTPTIIRASDITDLRRWLNDYEDNHSKSGVNSYSYSPNSPNTPRIALNWAENISDLSITFPPPVRCDIVASDSNRSSRIPSDTDAAGYGLAFQEYRGANLNALHAVMEFGFLNQGIGINSPNSPFISGSFYNSYILNFASKTAAMAKKLYDNSGVSSFILWNEPNDSNKPLKQLDPDHFASLLYHANAAIKAEIPHSAVIWGGVIFGPGGPNDQPDENALDFIRGTYNALSSRGLAGEPGKPWPWDAVNIHIHQVHWAPAGPNRTLLSVRNIFSSVRQAMEEEGRGDASPLLVGEYGVSLEEEGDHPGSMNNLFNWIKLRNPDGMFYFSHGRVIDNGNWALVQETYTNGGTRIEVDSEYFTYTFFKTLLETLP